MTTEDNQKTETSQPEPSLKADKAEAQPVKLSGKNTVKRDKPRGSGTLLAVLVFLLLILIAASAGIGYYGWMWWQDQLQLQQQGSEQVLQQSSQLEQLQRQLDQLLTARSEDRQVDEQTLILQDRLAQLQAQVSGHSKRLQLLSTTSKNDWLLAEAEYLLRLANQRLLMERGGTGALALLQAADEILLQLGDVDLFPIREQLARDIAALKLIPEVDRSGIYLKLSALGEQVMQLPTVPKLLQGESESLLKAEQKPKGDIIAEPSLWQKITDNFFIAMKKLADQVRIRHHDKPLEVLLPPDSERYLRQNIRFNLEQAQLALLREESAIYTSSLQQAESLLREYFPMQTDAGLIAGQLRELSSLDIAIHLPNISASLKQLKQYSAQLHKLDDRAGQPQLKAAPVSEAL